MRCQYLEGKWWAIQLYTQLMEKYWYRLFTLQSFNVSIKVSVSVSVWVIKQSSCYVRNGARKQESLHVPLPC